MLFYRQHSPPGSASDDRRPSDRSTQVRRSICEILDDLLLVSAVLDTVEKSSQDLGRILEALLLAHLRALRVQNVTWAPSS